MTRKAWPLVVNFCCPQGAKPTTCKRPENMGWRYIYIILGVLCLVMSILRTVSLRMSESPKWLVSQGRREEAAASINTISRINKSLYNISSSQLHDEQAESCRSIWTRLTMISGLFQGKNQARSMVCLILMWILVGIAYLPPSLPRPSTSLPKLINIPATPYTSSFSLITSKHTAPSSATEA